MLSYPTVEFMGWCQPRAITQPLCRQLLHTRKENIP